MLRYWHNQRYKGVPWKRLDIVIVTSTEPYLLINNLHQSPFNVGDTVELEDFTYEQVTTLNRLHGSPLDISEETKLMQMLNGHPYLVRQSLYLIVTQRVGIEELFATAATENGPFKEHLRYHLARLKMKQDLVQGMLQVIYGHSCPNADVLFRLQSAGLILLKAKVVLPRCQLYADYFGRHLQ